MKKVLSILLILSVSLAFSKDISSIKTNKISIKAQSATPTTNPAAGYFFVYPKTDGYWYGLDENGIETRITPYVTSVFGRTGDVTGTKADVGLGNVDNTSDADKPVSTAQQAALDAKQDSLGFTAVPDSRTVNGKALTSNITLNADDLGDGATNSIITLLQETNFETAYTHSQTTSGNPHNVTASDVGSSTAQWNADKIKSVSVDDTSKADGKVLTYNSTSGNLEYQDPPGASGGEANTASNVGAGVGIFKVKNLLDLEFKSLISSDGSISFTGNAEDVDLTIPATIPGTKTFSSFPVTPSAAPTTDYQVANKKYVDDNASASPLTTKGDIYTYSTANARLAVGTNGYVLAADSNEATGLKWIPLTGGGNMSTGTYDPAGIAEQLVGLTAIQTLTNKTFTSPKINVSSDATGDIYYRDASGNFTRLGVGTSGQVLTSNGTIPGWAAPSGGGGGGNPVLSSISGESFIYPKITITNPFSNAANSPNITFDVDNYADTVALVSTSSNEPMQLPKFTIPAATTSLKFRFVYSPETANSWASETVVWKGELKNMTDNTAWSSVSAFTIGTDTAPSSGSAPQKYEATISLATLGLSVGDVVQMVIFVDSTSTWAHDVAFQAAEVEVVQ